MLIDVDGALTDQQSDETGDSCPVHDSQARCITEISNERLYRNIASQIWSLVLLFFDSEQASMLLVEWLGDKPHVRERAARRVGIVKLNTWHHDQEREDQIEELLRCFSVEVDLRLI